MPRLAKLKRFARTQVEQLNLEFPVSTWERVKDPVKLNAIYSPKEWKLDSPSSHVTEHRQDWIHWFECDPSQGTYLEIFFRRLQERVAFAWVRLRVNCRLLILKQAFYRDNSERHTYSAGGIRLECTAPMRGWRLALNVIMEDPATGQKVHVRLGAQVAMTGHTLELPKQVRHSFLARLYHRELNYEKAKHDISKCCRECQAVLQPNSVFAEIILDGERQELMLFGSRLKCFGNSSFLHGIPIHVGYAENGTTFTAIEAERKAYGFCCNPTEYVQPIRKTRWSRLRSLQEPAGAGISLFFEAGGRPHELKMGTSTTTVDQVGEAGCLIVDGKEFKMQSTLLEISNYDIPKDKLESMEFLRFPSHRNHYLILSISTPDCKNPKLTGGKGSSLAVLSDVADTFETFTVPSALVLTTYAYKTFAETPEVSTAIEDFLRKSTNADMPTLKKASEECVSTISRVALPAPIQTLLLEKLYEVFGTQWYFKKFAVRSSAVGEDSEEMSAAGQMTTFLGMRGERKIASAIVKCWASQFALTAINYKRQYGQDLNGMMAVVVQEMVSAETAGVMFTCDPLTSNPTGIFITANYGLGESVVSATADPDTYSLRHEGSRIVLVSKSCGAKDRMVVEREYGTGTEEKAVAENRAKTFCLTDEKAIEIAKIGAALSNVTDSPRDIEWAIIGDRIYLLQSRPITSFLRESDFEIRHDDNSGMYTNREILSRANLDEVMPGAFSTLGNSIVGKLLFEALNKNRVEWGDTDRSQFIHMQNTSVGKKTFMNFSQKGLAQNKMIMKTTSVTMFGYDITEHEAIKNGTTHGGSAGSGWMFIKLMLNAMWKVEKTVNEVRAEALKVKLELPKNGNALAQFMSILRQIPKLDFFMDGLMQASMPSGIYNMFVLNIIKNSQGLKEFSPELMVLLSKLLRSDLEVESAHIPKELTVLSNILREEPEAKDFGYQTPEEALSWLESNDGVAAELFRTIRSKHAHRCYKEFDVHSKTWDIDPLPLVRTLQATVRSPEQNTPKKDEEFLTIEQLPQRPSFMQRRMLNFLIPRAKYAVYAREATKSALVKCIHEVRLALRKVGLQLQAEGRLPDPELIFFLSCDELYRLMTTKDPSLLPRALRRQKMHPILDQERFPVLLYGVPKPIDSTKITIDPNALSLTGTPVSEGVVEGPARVVFDFLTEAHLIKKGEILITRATDTGWTPYFPLLSGVVTEVGGLLSHGAVVAREYGLPAIVGLVGVTEFVKSGDIVTLDGTKGLIHKSRPTQNEGSEETVLFNREALEETAAPQHSADTGNTEAATEGTADRIAEGNESTASSKISHERVDGPFLNSTTAPNKNEKVNAALTSSETTPLIECEA